MWKSIRPPVFFYGKDYLYLYKQTIMAIRIQTYYRTTDMTDEQIRQAVISCKTQDYQVYQLFKIYGTLTSNDCNELYYEIIGPAKDSSINRSINTLKKNKVIYDTGNILGVFNRPVSLMTIIDNPPDVLKTFNKTIPKSISIKLIFDDNGKIDLDKMYNQTAEQLDFLINKYKL
jgi:hypothetical protein